MKLLILNWQDRLNPNAGGAEVHLHEIFGRLARRGHEVTLLVSRWPGAPRQEVVDGMTVIRVGSRHTFPIAAAAYYRGFLRGRDFDLVIEDLNKVPLWSPIWSRSPVVLLVHHLFGATAFATAPLPVAAVTWLSERPLPLVYRNLPVQVVSESTAEDLVRRGFQPKRIRVVHNGVDTKFFRPSPEVERTAEPTLIHVGRLQRYKRVDLIVMAVARLRARGVPVRLLIAGRGPEEEALRALARREGAGDRIDFLGYVDEERKRALFGSAWVHVITSPKEGWGLSVMEAAACGTPTVASRSPGLRDSVVHGETGLLVPHGDWRKLADELASLLSDQATLERMGAAAASRAENYTWDVSAARAERHLLSCIGASD